MSEDVLSNGRTGEGGRPVLLAALAAALVLSLAAAWLYTRSHALKTEERCAREEEKIDQVKKYFAANYSEIFGGRGEEEEVRMDGARLLTNVKELATECGLSGNIDKIDKEDGQKGEVSLGLAFTRIRMADLVNFLALTRTRYPGLVDREAKMQAVKGESDSWNVNITLTAKALW